MDNEQVLLIWINTILIDTQVSDITQFYDGVQFFQTMRLLNPDKFSMQDVEIYPESWIHRFQNLQLFNNQLQQFYQNVLFLKYDKNKIELMKIAKYKDKKNIIIILENILGACLSGADREYYIDKIINLEQDIQATLMPLIQQILDQQQSNETDITQNNYENTLNDQNQRFSTFNEANYQSQQAQNQIEDLDQKNDELNNNQKEMKIKQQEYKIKIDNLQNVIELQKKEIIDEQEEQTQFFNKLEVQNQSELEQQFNQKDKIIKQLQEQNENQRKDFKINYDEIQKEFAEKKKNILQLQKQLKYQENLEQKLENYQHMLENHKNIKQQEVIYIKQINELQQKYESQNETIQQKTDNMDINKQKCIESDVILTKLQQENSSLKDEIIQFQNDIQELQQKVIDQEFQTMNFQEFKPSNVIQQDLEIALQNIQSSYDIDNNSEQTNENVKSEILSKENEILRENLNQLVIENEQIKEQLKKSKKIQQYKQNDNIIQIEKKDEQIKLILAVINEKFIIQ